MAPRRSGAISSQIRLKIAPRGRHRGQVSPAVDSRKSQLGQRRGSTSSPGRFCSSPDSRSCSSLPATLWKRSCSELEYRSTSTQTAWCKACKDPDPTPAQTRNLSISCSGKDSKTSVDCPYRTSDKRSSVTTSQWGSGVPSRAISVEVEKRTGRWFNPARSRCCATSEGKSSVSNFRASNLHFADRRRYRTARRETAPVMS